MIIVTGGLGFIGSALVWGLNQQGIDDIIVVDDPATESSAHVDVLNITRIVDKQTFIDNLADYNDAKAVLHMGACSDTMETDEEFLINNNTRYTETLAKWCLANDIRYVYASSAATYGDGNQGYDDNVAELESLKPLNLYGKSKHDFDIIARDNGWLDKIVGLKFFNVYGPNESHKGRMASVVYHAFPQVKEGNVNLFKSYRDDYKDGEQIRDFIYVKDVVKAVMFFMNTPTANGLFNLGTGTARSFKDLATGVFKALDLEPKITFIPMPETLRDKYQYYTQANIEKLRSVGYKESFTSLEDAIKDYVQNYLAKGHGFRNN